MTDNPLSRENYEKRIKILAAATPWQVAELIVYLAQNLEPFCNRDAFDKSQKLSEHPAFADLASQTTSIKAHQIRSFINQLDRITY